MTIKISSNTGIAELGFEQLGLDVEMEYCLGLTLQWTSILSRGGRNTPGMVWKFGMVWYGNLDKLLSLWSVIYVRTFSLIFKIYHHISTHVSLVEYPGKVF